MQSNETVRSIDSPEVTDSMLARGDFREAQIGVVPVRPLKDGGLGLSVL